MRYITLQEATKFCSYSQEYLSLRARKGKLKAAKVGRNWHTTREWIEEYVAKQIIKQVEPPRNLPMFSADADMWEDGRPEEIKAQNAFLQKLQFATAFAMVIVLIGVSIVQGLEEIRTTALQQKIWTAGFLAGTYGAETGKVFQEYIRWLVMLVI